MVACRFWTAGFVALLGNNHLVAVSNYDEPRPKLLAVPPEEPVASWAIIPPAESLSRSVEVLLAIGQSIFVVDATDCEDRGLDRGPFQHVSVSANGKFVALYTEDGKVWVVSSDFQNRLSEYDSKVKTIPRDMQWSGNNAVVLAWEDEVHLVGPSGSASKYFYDGWVQLIPDCDGMRIFTNDLCEFLQRVPDATEEVFRLGSTSPASILLDAIDQLDKKSPKADDNIQLIRPDLDSAVDACVRAAGHEFSVHWQKQLLRAASFGKSVLDLYNSDEFVDMLETLRVLNAVRFFEVGMPLSHEQYLRLTPERLVRRLVNRNEYLLAVRIADYLGLPTEDIYVHWACQKVKTSSDAEEDVCRTIVQRLSGKPGISFEAIANAAYHEGRTRIATELLNYEPRAGKQVPLLLDMKEDSIALDKAVESGDMDLVYYVLIQLRKKLPLASFFRMINTRPVAMALVESSARDQDTELLKDLYYQDDRRLDGANLLFENALSQQDSQPRIDKVKLASKLLQDSRDHSFQARALDEAQRLLKVQDALDKDFGPTFSGSSLNDTIHSLVRLGHGKRAARLQAEFNVEQRTFAWLQLRGLVDARNWNALEELSKQRKSPINWEPYFNAVLGAGNTRLASLFIPKCTAVDSQERLEMWVKCGMVGKAAEEAFKTKDMKGLETLRDQYSAAGQDGMEVERYIGLLKGGKR